MLDKETILLDETPLIILKFLEQAFILFILRMAYTTLEY